MKTTPVDYLSLKIQQKLAAERGLVCVFIVLMVFVFKDYILQFTSEASLWIIENKDGA